MNGTGFEAEYAGVKAKVFDTGYTSLSDLERDIFSAGWLADVVNARFDELNESPSRREMMAKVGGGFTLVGLAAAAGAFVAGFVRGTGG